MRGSGGNSSHECLAWCQENNDGERNGACHLIFISERMPKNWALESDWQHAGQIAAQVIILLHDLLQSNFHAVVAGEFIVFNRSNKLRALIPTSYVCFWKSSLSDTIDLLFDVKFPQ